MLLGGYQTVEEFRYHSPIVKDFLKAGRDMGYTVRDLNGATQTGFMKSQGTLRDGLRCSTAKGKPLALILALRIPVQP